MKESTRCTFFFVLVSDDSEGFGLAFVEQCCHLLRGGRKECGEKPLLLFQTC